MGRPSRRRMRLAVMAVMREPEVENAEQVQRIGGVDDN